LQLASTPLLATILLLIWRNTGDLPERRVELYEYCCRVLIERWEAHHDVIYQSTLTKLDWKDHLHLLIPLAYFSIIAFAATVVQTLGRPLRDPGEHS
jgi:predicted NACHT family NTPase